MCVSPLDSQVTLPRPRGGNEVTVGPGRVLLETWGHLRGDELADPRSLGGLEALPPDSGWGHLSKALFCSEQLESVPPPGWRSCTPRAGGMGGVDGAAGTPLPTAVNKWQLADPAGQAAVTRAGQPMSCPAAVAPPAAGLPLAAAAAGGASGRQSGLQGPVSGRPGQICCSVPFTASPAGAASFLTFPTFWGRRAGCGGGVGRMAGRTAARGGKRLGELFPGPARGQLELGLRRREIRNPFAHSWIRRAGGSKNWEKKRL